MSFIENYRPALVLDLRDKTLSNGEKCVRVIDPNTDEWVGSILPDEGGFYDAHAGSELVRMIRCRYSMGLVV